MILGFTTMVNAATLSLSKTTLIFPLIEHITNNYPSLLKTYDGVFSGYINAYEALMVLCELKK